jgi:hypothetical protein
MKNMNEPKDKLIQKKEDWVREKREMTPLARGRDFDSAKPRCAFNRKAEAASGSTSRQGLPGSGSGHSARGAS